MKSIGLLIFILFGCLSAGFSQLSSGYVRFELNYDVSELSSEERVLLPSAAELWFREGLLKMELPLSAGMKSSVLVKGGETVVLMDLMGNKMALRSSRKGVDAKVKYRKNHSTIVDSAFQRRIAGYNCSKATMNLKDGDTREVWFTRGINASGSWFFNLGEIPGFPMEFSLTSFGIEMRMTAAQVRTEDVSLSLFEVPAGYRDVSGDDFNKMLGGAVR